MESRQVRRAIERRSEKMQRPKYPHRAQKGGPSTVRIRRNRRYRRDGNDFIGLTHRQ